MMTSIRAVLFGLFTIIVLSIIFTIITSIIFTTTTIDLAIQNKIIHYATYIICFIGGFICGRKTKRKVFYVAFILACLTIILPYLLFSEINLANLQMNHYFKAFIQMIVIICGAAIGSIGKSS